MEILPKFSGTDCDCLQTCRELLDFYVILCYYDGGNAQITPPVPLPVCAPGSRTIAGSSEQVQRGKVPPADLQCTGTDPGLTLRVFRTHPEAVHRGVSPSNCRKAVKIKESISRISPENRICRMQQSSKHPEKKFMPACMEPVSRKRTGLSKNAPCFF